MKKPVWSPLVMIALLFFSFALGCFLGRNQSRGELVVSLPSAMQEAPEITGAADSHTAAESTVPTETVFPININTASETELMELPGIGPELAGRIVRYREQVGKYSQCEELMNVSGIGEKRFEAMIGLITTGGQA